MKKFKNMRFKSKLTLIYSTVFLLVSIMIMFIIYGGIKNVITDNIEAELKNSSYLINTMIKTNIDNSIRNHLRTNSCSSLQIAEYYYELYQSGILTEKEAKEKVIEYIKLLKIGSTGYVYVLNSNGVLVHHPFDEFKNTDISEFEFVETQVAIKEGYIEYLWKNPTDVDERKKSLYMTYFEPWDWIISASSYREEFYDLLNVKDFEKQVLDLKFGKDGYPIILDYEGTFLVHPALKGHNVINENIDQDNVIQKVVENRNGTIEYNWKNPNEVSPRSKIVVFSELPEYNWIIATSAYKEDFYKPLNDITKIILLSFIFGFFILIFVTIKTSNSIIKPIKKLQETILLGFNGNLSVRAEYDYESKGEINQLAGYFNTFIESLELKTLELNEEVQKRIIASEQLEKLNENLEQIILDKTKELEEAQEDRIRNEKLTAINKLIKDIAHNINTPLGISITSATYIDKEINDLYKDYKQQNISKKKIENFFINLEESYNLLINGLRKSANLISMFKLITRDEHALNKRLLNVKAEIENSINNIDDKGHEVIIECADDIEINSYPSVLDLTVTHLVRNSLIHAFDNDINGQVFIKVKKDSKKLTLVVSDNGRGISAKNINHVFEPFYTEKPNIDNLGLGLSIVYHSVKHIFNGNIELFSEYEKGTEFKIEIPITNK